MWTAGTSASSSMSLLTAIRNIGPACGEAGAPTMVLTWVTRPAAGARSEIGAGRPRSAAGLRRRRRQPRQFLIFGDHLAFAHQQIGDLGALLIDPDHRFPARHDKSGDRAPGRRSRHWWISSTMTSAVPGVSFSSGWERCSNQYQPPPRAAKKTTANAGLRYSESIIAGSIQTCLRDVMPRRCRAGVDPSWSDAIASRITEMSDREYDRQKASRKGAGRMVAQNLASATAVHRSLGGGRLVLPC